MNYAFARTALLVAAIRLHLFTHLAQGTQTASELAERMGSKEDAIRRLLAGLQAIGLIEQAEKSYQLTPIAQKFLVEGKPGYLGGDTLAILDYIPAWFELDRTIQTEIPYRDLGDATTAEAFFAPRVRDLFSQFHPTAVRIVAELARQEPEKTPHKVLDLGAGSAPWSAAFALHYPSAQVTALDLPKVVEQGRMQIDKLELSERYTWIAADMEAIELAEDHYDLVILAHVSRFLSDQRVLSLLSRIVRSLRAGGSLLIADIFALDDRSGPPSAITLDLSMLVNTAHGRIRTCAEVAAWLENNGLHGARRLQVAGPFPVVIARKEERI